MTISFNFLQVVDTGLPILWYRCIYATDSDYEREWRKIYEFYILYVYNATYEIMQQKELI